MAHGSSTTTKSIDVGGVFLMDLSVNDTSDSSLNDHELLFNLNADHLTTSSSSSLMTHQSTAIPISKHNRNHHQQLQQRPRGQQAVYETNISHIDKRHNDAAFHQVAYHNHHQHQDHHHHQDKSIRLSPAARDTATLYNNSNSRKEVAACTRQVQQSGQQAPQPPPPPPPPTTSSEIYVGNSLDRSASVIYCDGQQEKDNDEPQQVSAVAVAAVSREPLSSLSDESYVPSSGTSFSASLTGSSELCEEEEEEEAASRELDEEFGDDRASTTTREDSGVLDMKDLVEGQSNKDGSYGCDENNLVEHNHQRQRSSDSSNNGGRRLVPQSLELQEKQQQQQQRELEKRPKEKSISANIMATNLINKSANGNTNFQYQQQAANNNNKNDNDNNNYNKPQQQQRSINKPTDGSGASASNNNQHHHNNYHHHHNNRSNIHHHHHHHSTSSKRSISASLPIQVPARQMKRDLNRMKLALLKKEEEEEQQQQQQVDQVHPPQIQNPLQQQRQFSKSRAEIDEEEEGDDENSGPESPPVRRGDRNRPALENIAVFCATATANDDDAFLNQEFNENHHNHYPIDELDDENLTAEEDPMRLFASIQALAKSLHEDAELFGSLPPKRMLESPIRSLALV